MTPKCLSIKNLCLLLNHSLLLVEMNIHQICQVKCKSWIQYVMKYYRSQSVNYISVKKLRKLVC